MGIIRHQRALETLYFITCSLYFLISLKYLYLEDAESVHPGDEATERGLASARHANQQQMPLRLTEDTIYTQNVFQHLVE